jgi:hypothetical protein
MPFMAFLCPLGLFCTPPLLVRALGLFYAPPRLLCMPPFIHASVPSYVSPPHPCVPWGSFMPPGALVLALLHSCSRALPPPLCALRFFYGSLGFFYAPKGTPPLHMCVASSMRVRLSLYMCAPSTHVLPPPYMCASP